MEKLRLEHLAPYLPYGLKVMVRLKTGDILKETLIALDAYENVFTGFNPWITLSDICLILHPLSDLVKVIEVDEEKFVPLKYIYGSDFTPNDQFFENMDTLCIGYREMLLLFEWHFDVFGLIEKGLAIDINTL